MPMPGEPSRRLSLDEYADGVLAGHRPTLARAITLIESSVAADRHLAAQLLARLQPHTGQSRRIGITGPPGAGKSTFLESLGRYLTQTLAEPVAVLAVDPSSPLSGGSILGDKTRMPLLSADERAFVRPSPSRGHTGGVARHTRETILLCEAAGFRNVFVETVGVGQSEVAIRSITDFFLLLLPPAAGDGLQGIKRGVVELADCIAINKADGELLPAARRAMADYAAALHLFPPASSGWRPEVVLCSALTQTGVEAIWQIVLRHRQQLDSTGVLVRQRHEQALQWLTELIHQGLESRFRAHEGVAAAIAEWERAVATGAAAPAAAEALLRIFDSPPPRK
jgi:LAO/AO transport system kinase